MNVFDPHILRELYTNYIWLFNFAVLIIAGLLTYYFIPKVLWLAREKNLFKTINSRSSHRGKVPSLGGVAFYIVFILVITLLQSAADHVTGNHLIGAVTIMFMIGVKDDLVISTARVKLIGQMLATTFIIFSPVMKLTTLSGFMGIYEIPSMVGYIISAFIIIAIVNSYNLIDGVNGLAGIIGIVISGVFALTFALIGDHNFFVLLSLFVMGTLTSFLRFNFSRGDKKIFMGDSGSLMMGLIFGVLTIKLLKINQDIELIGAGGDVQHRLLFLGAVLFLLFFDTSRVMIVRLLKKESPFKADRNHLHHILLDLGLSHLKTSIILGVLNMLIIGLYIFLGSRLSTVWLIVSLAAIYILLFALCGLAKRVVLKKNYQKSFAKN